jgi:hypothetical protein
MGEDILATERGTGCQGGWILIGKKQISVRAEVYRSYDCSITGQPVLT